MVDLAPEQQAALEEHAKLVAEAQIRTYQTVEAIINEAIDNGDPVILTRVLRKAIGRG